MSNDVDKKTPKNKMLKNAKFGFHVAHNVSIFKLGGVQV
jgi:hypothetical protein